MDLLNADQRAAFEKYKKLFTLQEIVGYDSKQLREFNKVKLHRIILKYLDICHQKESASSINDHIQGSSGASNIGKMTRKEMQMDSYGRPFVLEKQKPRQKQSTDFNITTILQQQQLISRPSKAPRQRKEPPVDAIWCDYCKESYTFFQLHVCV